MSPIGVPEYDWEGRPRLATSRKGAVAADHGRCSQMGMHSPCHMWQSVSQSKHQGKHKFVSAK